MLSRSARGPVVIGLGTAAILAAATAPALPASTAASTVPSPPRKALDVTTTTVTGTAHPGGSVQVRIWIDATGGTAVQTLLTLHADHQAVLASGSGLCHLAADNTCGLGTVTSKKVLVKVLVTVPGSFTSGKIVVSAKADATGFQEGSDESTITVTVPPTPSPTPTPTTDPSPSPTASPSHNPSPRTTATATLSPSASKSATISAPTTGPSGSNPSALAYLPPSPAGTPTGVPDSSVAFPPVAAAPSVAPSVTMTGLAGHTTALRSGSPGSQDLAFERIASTQAAWLAALLVALSVLLTQVRLGRPRLLAQHKGIHRRPRRRPFPG